MRVMIIEDDPATRAILVRIAKRIWLEPTLDQFEDASNALNHFKAHGAELILLDLSLIGISGESIIATVRKSKVWVPIIVITSRADRDTVLMARTYRVDGYVIKPINPTELLARIREIMGITSDDFSRNPTDGYQSPMEFVKAELRADRVSVPIAPEIVGLANDFSQALNKNEQITHFLDLLTEPALVTRLLGIANTSPYAPESGDLVENAGLAIEKIGNEALTNLVNELSLYPGAFLTHATLTNHAQQFRQECLDLTRLLTTLGKYADFDLNACVSASMLFRVGELTLLQLMQRWLDANRELTAEDCTTILTGCSADAAARIKGLWQIPKRIRMRIGATYALPQGGALKTDIIAMRAAGLLFHGQHIHELDKLLTSLRIPSERWDEMKQIKANPDSVSM